MLFLFDNTLFISLNSKTLMYIYRIIVDLATRKFQGNFS